MSKQELPDRVDIVRMTNAGAVVAGEIPAEFFSRLEGVVEELAGPVNVSLSFRVDDEGHRVIEGDVAAKSMLVCQRCLETMPFDIHGKVALAVVRSDGLAGSVPDCYEPLVMDGTETSLWDVVEDELLLNLPSVPMHEDEGCSEIVARLSKKEEVETVKENPFNVLLQLKK